MAKIDLTDAERLILANQHEILSLLKDGDQWHARLAGNLRDGHKWIYEDALQLSEDLSAESAEYVLEILGIYGALRSSYEQLQDKSGIEERQLMFPGFDGNNEGDLLSFTRALSANGNFHETIGKDARNSHMPTRDGYSRMIGAWRKLGKPNFPYTRDQIIGIVNARHRSVD